MARKLATFLEDGDLVRPQLWQQAARPPLHPCTPQGLGGLPGKGGPSKRPSHAAQVAAIARGADLHMQKGSQPPQDVGGTSFVQSSSCPSA